MRRTLAVIGVLVVSIGAFGLLVGGGAGVAAPRAATITDITFRGRTVRRSRSALQADQGREELPQLRDPAYIHDPAVPRQDGDRQRRG